MALNRTNPDVPAQAVPAAQEDEPYAVPMPDRVPVAAGGPAEAPDPEFSNKYSNVGAESLQRSARTFAPAGADVAMCREAARDAAGSHADVADEILPTLMAAGVTDPAQVYELVKTAVESSPGHEMEALKNLPAIVAAGVRDPAVVGDMMRVASSYGRGTIVFDFLPALARAGVTDQNQMAQMIDAVEQSVGADDPYRYMKIGGAYDCAEAILGMGITDPGEFSSFMTDLASLGPGYLDNISKCLPAFERAGVSDREQIREVLRTAISAATDRYSMDALESLPVLIEAGITDPTDVGELVEFFVREGRGYFSVAFSSIPRSVLNSGNVSKIERAWRDILKDDDRPDDLGFAVKNIKWYDYKIYNKYVALLRESGFTDEEIVSIIEKTPNRFSPDVRPVSCAYKALEALHDMGIAKYASKEEIVEWMNIATSTDLGIDQEMTAVINEMIPSARERYRLYKTMGQDDFMQFMMFAYNSKDNLSGRNIYDLASMCYDVEERHGIRMWGRYSVANFEHLLAPKSKGKPTAFVITARNDWNGAFYGVGEDVNTLVRAGYQVEIVEAEDEDQIYEVLGSFPDNYISAMHIYGHGIRTQTGLGSGGEKSVIGLNDADEWRRYRSKFVPGFDLFLNSCSTGEGGAGAENILSAFSEWLPVGHAEAPQDPRGGNLYINNNGEVRKVYSSHSDREDVTPAVITR